VKEEEEGIRWFKKAVEGKRIRRQEVVAIFFLYPLLGLLMPSDAVLSLLMPSNAILLCLKAHVTLNLSRIKFGMRC
jgi:hypothetical protein